MPAGSAVLTRAARTLGLGCPRALLCWPRPWSCCAALPASRCRLPVSGAARSVHVKPGGGAARVLIPLPVHTWLCRASTAAGDMAEQRYCVDYAKRGTAGCKKCKEKIVKGMVRIGKIVPNPFTESGGDMKEWYHVKCMFEKLEKARASTKKIEDITDLEGWEELQDGEKELITNFISGEMPGGSWDTAARLLLWLCHQSLHSHVFTLQWQNHRTAWGAPFGSNPLLRAGCSHQLRLPGACPAWPWAPPWMGYPQLSGQQCRGLSALTNSPC